MRAKAGVLTLIVTLLLACNLSVEPLNDNEVDVGTGNFTNAAEDDFEASDESAASPGTASAAPDGTLPALAEVEHWLYLIDVNLDDETAAQITASDYQMVVIDFITSEKENGDFPLAALIEKWHEAPVPKIVLAYIDIGQAESYRTYWEPDWEIGDPAWIAGDDPDGWEENYPVAYWEDAWRDIWLADDGYLAEIVAVGFDGVYLDWVEAYSDENVLSLAEADAVEATEEMIWFVEDIAAFGRAYRPDFIVIGQNAAELGTNRDYQAAIDAIAQEQVWFDGGADNDPPGDCPLPRLERDIDSDAYRDSLSRACRRQYDDYPESTLHVSSEGYLADLTAAQAQGILIFTVDYALEPANVAWVYERSRELGFVPFVGSRALDGYLPVVP